MSFVELGKYDHVSKYLSVNIYQHLNFRQFIFETTNTTKTTFTQT